MKNLGHFSKKLRHISCCSWTGLAWLHQSFCDFLWSFLHVVLFRFSEFSLELCYFVALSLLGFLALKGSKTRSLVTPLVPKDIDFLFTSVSAVTVSSMSTVEMEVFSNFQLVLLTILMFVGGEVFVSMLGLHLMKAKMNKEGRLINYKIDSESSDSNDTQTELGTINHFDVEKPDAKPETEQLGTINHFDVEKPDAKPETEQQSVEEAGNLKLKSIKTLAYLVSCYLLVVHAIGSTLISIYFVLIPSARKVLNRKHINLETFSVFTTVSTFANCGFVPTNENMLVFKKNSGLLLILIPQMLMGNTLYPVFLRLLIWFMDRMTKRAEFRFMLRNSREFGYGHLLPGRHSFYLAVTVFGFIVMQLIIFCSLEWNSEAIGGGMSASRKLVGSLFQVVNSRHTGQSVFDLSGISPAILVLFVFMMYLPPYASYLPTDKVDDENISTNTDGGKKTRKNQGFCEHILFSQLTYLLIFVILICITERQKMKNDPLNFNVLSIVFEVISAYGNVGFSLGYSCERQINPDGHCKDAWSGLAGRWSNAGKFVLIVVMFFGRLKKFSKNGGRAWILS